MRIETLVALLLIGLAPALASAANGDIVVSFPEGTTPILNVWDLRGDLCAVALTSDSDPGSSTVLIVDKLSGDPVTRNLVVKGRVTNIQISEDQAHLLVRHNPAGDELTADTSLVTAAGSVLWTFTEPRVYKFTQDGSHVWSYMPWDPGREGRTVIVYRLGDASRKQTWDLGGGDLFTRKQVIIPSDGREIFIPRRLGYSLLWRTDSGIESKYDVQFPVDTDDVITSRGVEPVRPGLVAIRQQDLGLKLIDLEDGSVVFDLDPETLPASHPGYVARDFRGLSAMRGPDAETVVLQRGVDESAGWSLSLATGQLTRRSWNLEAPAGYTRLPFPHDNHVLFLSDRDMRLRRVLDVSP